MYPFSPVGNIPVFRCTIFSRCLLYSSSLDSSQLFQIFQKCGGRNSLISEPAATQLMSSRLVVLLVAVASFHFWQVILVEWRSDVNRKFVSPSSTPVLLYFNQTTQCFLFFSSGCIFVCLYVCLVGFYLVLCFWGFFVSFSFGLAEGQKSYH